MLRKITIDNSVRYVSKDNHSLSEQVLRISKQKDCKLNTRKRKFPILNFHKKNFIKKKQQKDSEFD